MTSVSAVPDLTAPPPPADIQGGVGLYNFRPTVRPVPLEIHIHGFPGKHYCPRMATMNRPTFKGRSAAPLYVPP